MIEFLTSLTWPGAVALLGTIVTIVTGLFALLITFRKPPSDKIPSNKTPSISNEEYEKVHSRINALTERVAEIEGDIKEIRAAFRSVQKQIADHEIRDIEDFKLVEAKLDRLMDIVVKILQEDKL